MSPGRLRTLALGLVAGLGLAALVVLGNTDAGGPASPAPQPVEVEYEGYW